MGLTIKAIRNSNALLIVTFSTLFPNKKLSYRRETALQPV